MCFYCVFICRTKLKTPLVMGCKRNVINWWKHIITWHIYCLLVLLFIYFFAPNVMILKGRQTQTSMWRRHTNALCVETWPWWLKCGTNKKEARVSPLSSPRSSKLLRLQFVHKYTPPRPQTQHVYFMARNALWAEYPPEGFWGEDYLLSNKFLATKWRKWNGYDYNIITIPLSY